MELYFAVDIRVLCKETCRVNINIVVVTEYIILFNYAVGVIDVVLNIIAAGSKISNREFVNIGSVAVRA